MRRGWLALVLLTLWPPLSHAYFQMDLMKAKKARIEAQQWTLADWLAQKHRLSLMDQWLVLHSSNSWFELDLSALNEQYKQKLETDAAVAQNAMLYRADMFFSLIDVAGEFQKTNDQLESSAGAIGLRLLGTSVQTTSLIVRYGLRHLNDGQALEHWDDQFAEGLAQLYIFKFLGIDGSYRYYFPTKSNLGRTLNDARTEAGAFAELEFVRLYGGYFWEPITEGIDSVNRAGWQFGLKLLF